MTTEPFTLERPVWTEVDFEQLNWHDVHIHAIAFRPNTFELWLDIDYIFAWVDPQGGETHYRFWVAPATLVFTNVHSIRIDLEFDDELSLQGVSRSEPCSPRNAEHLTKKIEWLWLLDCNEGEITFRSNGFSQFTRRPPILVRAQQLAPEERDGVSFATEYAPPSQTTAPNRHPAGQ